MADVPSTVSLQKCIQEFNALFNIAPPARNEDEMSQHHCLAPHFFFYLIEGSRATEFFVPDFPGLKIVITL